MSKQLYLGGCQIMVAIGTSDECKKSLWPAQYTLFTAIFFRYTNPLGLNTANAFQKAQLLRSCLFKAFSPSHLWASSAFHREVVDINFLPLLPHNLSFIYLIIYLFSPKRKLRGKKENPPNLCISSVPTYPSFAISTFLRVLPMFLQPGLATE